MIPRHRVRAAKGWTEGLPANVLVEVNAAVGKLAELSSLLDLCCAKGLSAIEVLFWRMCVHPPCIEAICPRAKSYPDSRTTTTGDHIQILPTHFSLGDLRVMGRDERGFKTYRQPPRRSGWTSRLVSKVKNFRQIRGTHVFGVSHFCSCFL